MNIFVLDPNPAVAASYHCDQHLHKMILESAQMVSTVLSHPSINLPGLYKPTHPNHPCTKWVAKSKDNLLWICELASELDNVRQSVSNCGSHTSMEVIKIAKDYINESIVYRDWKYHTTFIFAGPAIISIRPGSTVDHYRQYYRKKHNNWLLDNGVGMTYKGRSVPDFMADLIPPTT